MAVSLWQQCIGRLQDELSAQQFSMWIRPLQAEMDGDTLVLYAPNRFVLDWVRDKYINIINQFFTEQMGSNAPKLRFDIGSRPSARPVAPAPVAAKPVNRQTKAQVGTTSFNTQAEPIINPNHRSNINPTYQFDNFVEGKSNQLGKAAALQVSENPGGAYNPLFLYGGTGLGLPIVKSIVEAMGSQVKIDSKIDKGSRFYFQVNLKRASKEELLKTIKKKEYDFKGKKVLLVEDNQINVMVGQQILEKVNLNVEVARNGLEAVNMVKENHFDIILMDIQMPIMDGYLASKEIRKFNKQIPILALSASVFMEVKDKMEECGMNGFIFKPFDPEDLLNQIENATKNS